jgi:hypothetical protein
MEKKEYEKLKDIKQRIADGKPTTFAERNIVNITEKKSKKAKQKKIK